MFGWFVVGCGVMITEKMISELRRISRGEKLLYRSVNGALVRRGFAAKKEDGEFVLTDDGRTLLNFWSRS